MKNKEKNLTYLYSVRAGISLISLEKKKLDKTESDVRSAKYRIEDNEAEIINYDGIAQSSKKSLKQAKHDYECAKREYDKKSFPAFFWNIITVIAIIASVYLYFTKNTVESYDTLFKILTVFSFVFTAFAFLKALVKTLKVRPIKKRIKQSKELMRNSQLWMEEADRGMRSTENTNRSLESKYSELEGGVKTKEKLLAAASNALNLALRDAFASELPAFYWSKLDMLIERISSGEAESLTKAAALVENALSSGSTEALVEAAHKKVYSGASLDLDLIHSFMNKSFERLVSAFEKRADESLKSLDFGNKKGTSSEAKEYFKEFCTISSLRSALLSEIDSNSMQLAREAESVQVYY